MRMELTPWCAGMSIDASEVVHVESETSETSEMAHCPHQA